MYVGSGTVQYPHTRVYTELQLGFMLDANLSALKFLNKWLDFIFSGDGKLGTVQEWQDQQTNKSLSQLQSLATTSIRPENRAVRLKYRDEYACTMLISKTEQGPYAANQRAQLLMFLKMRIHMRLMRYHCPMEILRSLRYQHSSHILDTILFLTILPL